MKRLSGLSIDVDSVASHLQGYGFQDGVRDGTAYDLAIPRALEVFGACGARGTFFLIAEEAALHRDVVRAVVAEGHEVGCHSMSHSLPFDLTDRERRRKELVEARAVLEETAGVAVTGFRAPSWDTQPLLLPSLAEAGYRYDASSYPTWMLLLHRLTVARRSGAQKNTLGAPISHLFFGRTKPHTVRLKDREVAEIPICTAPFVRIPYYHTLRYLLPAPAFRALVALTRTRRGPLGYVFHAVDFLGVQEDRLDPRIGRHPGMNRPLAEKLSLAGTAVRELAGGGRVVVALQAIAESMLAGT
jgi:peptidoglycan-N-acetylglucosamine deacetylase